jgi:polyhydroxybutyrate depolymerase
MLAAFLVGCASSGPPGAPAQVPDAHEPAPAIDARTPTQADVAPVAEPDARLVTGPDATSALPDLLPVTDLPPSSTGERSAGCGMAAGLPEGQATIAVGGANRTYILHLPTGYSGQRAWPLVLALHPNGGAGIGYWDGTTGARSIRSLAREKAIVVLPLARPMGGGFDWRGDLPADLAYFEALMTRLQEKLCIDKKRIFAVGFSGGGSFAGVLACRRTDIRAFASGSGVAYYDPKDCVGTAAAWLTVGADELIAARAEYRDFWVKRNGCQVTTSPTAPATCQAYACPKESPVHHCVHPGGHLWPDYGTDAAWTFFQQF